VNPSTSSASSVSFLITGATAADFSPDSLKAYIVAGSTLYVYSRMDALQTIPLTAPANDVSFLSEGAFAYLAGGDPSGIAVRRTCDNANVTDAAKPSIPAPTFIRTLPGAAALIVPPDTQNTLHLLALEPSTIDIISVNTTPSGCTPSVSDGPISSFNLGLGTLVPKQLIISQDGSTAYVIAANLSSILVFDIAGQVSTALSLAGNATPLQAALSSDGTLLYVGASDGMVHVVDTRAGGDIQQVSFPQGLCQNSAGQPFPVPCKPNLIAVKP